MYQPGKRANSPGATVIWTGHPQPTHTMQRWVRAPKVAQWKPPAEIPLVPCLGENLLFQVGSVGLRPTDAGRNVRNGRAEQRPPHFQNVF